MEKTNCISLIIYKQDKNESGIIFLGQNDQNLK